MMENVCRERTKIDNDTSTFARNIFCRLRNGKKKESHPVSYRSAALRSRRIEGFYYYEAAMFASGRNESRPPFGSAAISAARMSIISHGCRAGQADDSLFPRCDRWKPSGPEIHGEREAAGCQERGRCET